MTDYTSDAIERRVLTPWRRDRRKGKMHETIRQEQEKDAALRRAFDFLRSGYSPLREAWQDGEFMPHVRGTWGDVLRALDERPKGTKCLPYPRLGSSAAWETYKALESALGQSR